MSRAEFIRFIGVLQEDSDLRDQFAEAQPEEILRLAKTHGFSFQKKFKVDFRTDGQECISAHMQTPSVSYAQNLYRTALRHLEYSQTTCSKEDEVERYDFRAGGYYQGSSRSNKIRKLFPRDCRIQHSSFHLLSSRQPCNTR